MDSKQPNDNGSTSTRESQTKKEAKATTLQSMPAQQPQVATDGSPDSKSFTKKESEDHEGAGKRMYAPGRFEKQTNPTLQL